MILTEAEIAEDRAFAEEQFTDTCRITGPGSGPRTFSETTGQWTDPPRVVTYQGPCRFQVRADINSNVIETTAGEREWTYLTSTLQVPIAGSESIRPDNVAEVLTAPYDPSIVGRLFNIQGIYHKSLATHRRFRTREVIS